ncbi:MAG: hypothetical protein ACTSRE_07650 [Promethearchaeota archaeon]
MSIFVLIPIGVALGFYILFVLWYGGWGKPLTSAEVDEYLLTIKKNAGIENEPEPELLRKFRELAKSDDGKDFILVNLIKFKDTNPESEAMKANDRYSRYILPRLLKIGSHPVFAGKKTGQFITPESADEWDQVAMVRYRSRRDMIKMVVQASKHGGGGDKWISIQKTYVFPVKSILRFGSLRIGVFVFLTILALVIAIFL